MKRQGIIFDLNGSLDNTDQAIAKAFWLTLRKHFPEREDGELQRFAKELVAFFWQADKLADLKYPQWDMADIINRGVSRWSESRGINVDTRQFAKDYSLIRKKFLAIRPEFTKLINQTPKNLLKFILSQGNSERDVLTLLNKSSLTESDFTEIVLSGSFQEENKPSINILEYILKKYSLSPAECLLVGDDVCSDIMPAKILGMKTLLTSDYVDAVAADTSQACALIKSMLEI